MKIATKDMVIRRAQRTGDGTYASGGDVWGWDDKDMSEEDKKLVQIIYTQKSE